MDSDPAGGATRIDFSNWERRELFAFFDSFSEPFHGVCLRVDCTESFRCAKDRHLSVFLTLLHRSLVAVNQVDNFMLRSVDGEVWRYGTIHGGSAVGRPNGTIGFGYYTFRRALQDFVREASVEVARVKAGDELARYPGQDLIRYSVLPWLDFTSLSHARNLARKDSTPLITFGKITHANGRSTMPVSIHVHHGLADGEHVARFVELFEQKLAAPESD
jgi:chloramphenicol O-acetyltransferase type A